MSADEKVVELPDPVGAGPLLLRGEEALELLGIGRSTVYELMAAGEVPVVRIGRSVRIPRHALYRCIEERTEFNEARCA